jgi:hypothetical protein
MSLTLTRRYNVDRFGYLIPTRYGNVPMVGAVATYRPGEGRFGGAVAVEEGTTNLVPSNSLKFEGWGTLSGAQVTLTQNVEFPEIGRNDATRIRSTGGTNVLKYYTFIEVSIADQAYTGSVYIKNIGSKPVRFSTHLGPIATVNPGEWTRAIVSAIGNGRNQFQFRFETLNVDDDLDFIAWGPQAERKPFATSFVDGTRANGDLRYYDESAGGNDYTIALWAKTHTNDPSTWQPLFDGRNARSQSMLAFNTSDVLMILYKNSSGVYDFRSTGFSMGDRTGWHHYVLTFTGPRSSGTFRVFVDGQLVYTHKDSLQLPGTFGMYIGRGTPTNELWNGLIDELLILPYAASEEEIASWYEAQGLLPPHPQASLQWDRQAVRPAQMVKL